MDTTPHSHSTSLPHGEGQEGGLCGTSPVALFVYNRADNTRRTLRALMDNTLAPQTDLYVFSDGGKDPSTWAAVNDVRTLLHQIADEVARTHALRSITIIERPTNYYLERNVIEGINYVLSRHDTIIVLEDDILTAPYFLQFINDALTLYRHQPRVMHVSGFSRLSPAPSLHCEGSNHHFTSDEKENSMTDSPSHSTPSLTGRAGSGSSPLPTSEREGGESASALTYFTPFMAGWGWGTWRDRWQDHFRHYHSREEALHGLTTQDLDALQYDGAFPCLTQLDRTPIPWDICWGIAIHRAHGLCLYPARTLVRNIGLHSGTHYGGLYALLTRILHSPLIQRYEYDRAPFDGPIPLTPQTPATSPHIEAAMRQALADWGIRYTPLGRLLRRMKQFFTRKTD